MSAQLNYLIAQQHRQDLIRSAGRRRLLAEPKATPRSGHEPKGLNGARAWITSAVAQARPANTRGAHKPIRPASGTIDP